MKETTSAVPGFLPSAANKIAVVTSVSTTAITGDPKAMRVERSARRSSTSCMTYSGAARLRARTRLFSLPMVRHGPHDRQDRYLAHVRREIIPLIDETLTAVP